MEFSTEQLFDKTAAPATLSPSPTKSTDRMDASELKILDSSTESPLERIVS
jgi:hypothetical protein